MQERFDLVLYGASGFTGAYVLESFVTSDQFGVLNMAVAGRSESKLHKTLKEVGELTDSTNAEQLANMARQAKVIINVVGPYRLYGEPVVKAAVENGACHVDISGEPAWLESMQMKYGEEAERNGVFVCGACGWDSVPADMGVNWLKKNFGGTLSHVEAFPQIKSGSAGYSFNAGTYQTLILGVWQAKNDGLSRIRKAIMPERPTKSKLSRLPKRKIFWWNDTFHSYCLPFMGADKSIIQRSQYFDWIMDNSYPAAVETYILVKSWFWAIALIIWLSLFNIAVKYDFTRSILQKYPGICSGYMFKESGPTREQAKQASFTYWFVGWGWADKIDPLTEEHPPKKVVIARCDGPDAGYIATSGCILSCALTMIYDRDHMPTKAGVYTTAAAFKNTGIYERLEKFGITFRTDSSIKVQV